jgi:hypothetical protein
MKARRVASVLAAASLAIGAGIALPATQASATACEVGWGSLAKSDPDYTGKSITNVRTGRHNCFDRMVVDVPGASAASLGYYVRYVDQVVMDGSGQTVPLNGGAKIQISVHAPAYDINTGQPTYSATPGQKLPGVNLTGYQTFKDAKYAGSFEGQTQIGLGVRARLPFRVMPLDGKLVVDVAHDWEGNWYPVP